MTGFRALYKIKDIYPFGREKAIRVDVGEKKKKKKEKKTCFMHLKK